jgi:PAS domain S-box-containing protein
MTINTSIMTTEDFSQDSKGKMISELQTALDLLKASSLEEVTKLKKENHALQRELEVFTRRKERSEKAFGHLIKKELEESEALYKAIVKASPDSIVVADMDGFIRMVSPSTLKMFGYPNTTEIRSKNFIDFLHHEDIPAALENIEKLKNGESLLPIEYRLIKYDGTYAESEITGDFIRSEQNEITGLVFIIRDIRQRKQAENALRYSETKYRTLIEAANDGIFIILNGIVIFTNQRLLTILGYTYNEIVGKPFLNFVHDDEKQRIQGYYLTRLAGGDTPSLYETKTVLKNGNVVDIEVNATTLDYNGLKATMVLLRDISRRKLREQTEKVFIRLSEFAYHHDLNELITRVLDESELLAQSEIAFYHFIEEDQLNIQLQTWSTNTIQSGCKLPQIEEHYPLDKAGVWVDCVQTGKPVIHNDYVKLPHRKGMPESHVPLIRELTVPIIRAEKIVAIIGVGNKSSDYTPEDVDLVSMLADMSWDIIVRKLSEEKIKVLNAELEERVLERTSQLEAANKDLESFAHSVSHDLRAPLRHIDGFTRILAGSLTNPSEEESQTLSVIIQSAAKMNTMINDLLTFSRLGRKSLVKAPVDLNELLGWVLSDAKKTLKDRQVEWKVGPLPVVLGDANLLVLVFENLLSNALKFTSRCKIAVIEIGCQDMDAPIIFIRDNGVGFDMKYADKLFGVFQRLHTQEEFEGTGVGLANVKQIVQKHGGIVYAEAKPGEGATFFVKL